MMYTVIGLDGIGQRFADWIEAPDPTTAEEEAFDRHDANSCGYEVAAVLEGELTCVDSGLRP